MSLVNLSYAFRSPAVLIHPNQNFASWPHKLFSVGELLLFLWNLKFGIPKYAQLFGLLNVWRRLPKIQTFYPQLSPAISTRALRLGFSSTRQLYYEDVSFFGEESFIQFFYSAYQVGWVTRIVAYFYRFSDRFYSGQVTIKIIISIINKTINVCLIKNTEWEGRFELWDALFFLFPDLRSPSPPLWGPSKQNLAIRQAFLSFLACDSKSFL